MGGVSHAPMISVVVPCFDLGRFLDEAVASVLAQTWQGFEILVVDDGSTDPGTVALLDDFDRPKTRVLRTSHGGLAAARNHAIAQARGEYLCALDADDKLHPTYFEKALRAFEADPELSFVSCWLEAFGERQWSWQPADCDLPTLLARCTIATAALVRRQAVLEVGGYATDMPHHCNEDWDLWLSLVERGHRGTILPEVLFYYRQRAGSLSDHAWYGAPHVEEMRYLLRKHAQGFRDHHEEVLRRKDLEVGELLRENRVLEDEIRAQVADLESRRAELARLEAKVARAEERRRTETRSAELEQACARLRAEVEALRSSKSWRITAPLRRAQDALRALRGERR